MSTNSCLTPQGVDLKWLEENLPHIPVELLDDVVEIAHRHGVEAVGTFYNGIIQLAKNSPKGTEYHEAGHAVFWSYLSPEQRNRLLNEASKITGIERSFDEKQGIIGGSKFKEANTIDFTLKSIDILNSDKAKQVFEKGNKNGWDLNKILTELQVPKEQKQLILDKGFRVLTNNDARLSNEPDLREQIIIDLLSNYSYTVEINTAKEPTINKNVDYENDGIFDEDGNFQSENTTFSVNGYLYEKDKFKHIPFGYGKIKSEDGYIGNNDWESISEREYEEALDEFKSKEGNERPTQHYSNLTVPGGTNYTENEISTPLITPSIKGHAEFASDNGIGWFRSDESLNDKPVWWLIEPLGDFYKRVSNPENADYYNEAIKYEFNTEQKAKEANKKYSNKWDINYQDITRDGSKTRRILELQSDLFQKGRDKSMLIKVTKSSEIPVNEFVYEDKFSDFKTTFIKKEDKWYDKSNQKYPLTEQVVVDGYNSFTSESRNVINQSKSNQFLQLLNKDNNWVTFFIKSIIQDSAKKGYEKVLFPRLDTIIQIESAGKWKTYEEAEKAMKDETWYNEDKKLRKILEAALSKPKEEQNLEHILRLKEQIASHQPSLLNTAKFYENDVTNILNKTYGKENVKLITDEYGNTWNEISLSDEIIKQTELIKLKASNESAYKTNDDKLEEHIMNGMEDFMKHKIPSKSNAIQNFYNKIKFWIKEKLGLLKIHDLYSGLNSGYFKNKKPLNLISNSAKFKDNNLVNPESNKQLPIKEGVEELFESNPELANEVYEALGFKSKPDVILPIGTSGSGKSTFIKSLPQENLVVIEPDSMRVEFTGDINDKSKDKEIYEEAAKRAVQAIKQGKQVVFDTTNLTKDKRLPFIEAIKKVIPTANIQYKLMELNPELAKQRIKADIAAGKNRANVPDATIDRHAESYKQMLEDIKNEPISNFEITPQQKQQAQQLYSQYLESLNKPNTNPILQGNQTNIEEIITHLEKDKLLEIDCKGKLKANLGLTTNQNPKFGDWEIIKDLQGKPSHKQGGFDLNIKGNTIEAEGNELVLKNSVGDLAIIPKKDRFKIKDLISTNDEKGLNDYISKLPKEPNKAGDGGIYSDKYVKNNFFNRIFRRNDILEKQIMDENKSLYNVGKLKDFKVLEATGKSKEHLEKTNRNPEYFPKGDSWFPYLDDVSQPIKLPNKNKYRTLVNDDNLSDNQLRDAVKFDFISHSLHQDKRYNELSSKLSKKLLTKYDQKFIDNNGGTDAYVRGLLSDSEEYKPYKNEMSFIEPEFINEFKNYVKTGK